MPNQPIRLTRIATISRITAPKVRAQNAPQKLIPKPSVEPSKNWLSAEIWPKRCTATDHQEYREASGTRVNAKSSTPTCPPAMEFLRVESEVSTHAGLHC